MKPPESMDDEACLKTENGMQEAFKEKNLHQLVTQLWEPVDDSTDKRFTNFESGKSNDCLTV